MNYKDDAKASRIAKMRHYADGGEVTLDAEGKEMPAEPKTEGGEVDGVLARQKELDRESWAPTPKKRD